MLGAMRGDCLIEIDPDSSNLFAGEAERHERFAVPTRRGSHLVALPGSGQRAAGRHRDWPALGRAGRAAPRHVDFLRMLVSIEETAVEVSKRNSPTASEWSSRHTPRTTNSEHSGVSRTLLDALSTRIAEMRLGPDDPPLPLHPGQRDPHPFSQHPSEPGTGCRRCSEQGSTSMSEYMTSVTQTLRPTGRVRGGRDCHHRLLAASIGPPGRPARPATNGARTGTSTLPLDLRQLPYRRHRDQNAVPALRYACASSLGTNLRRSAESALDANRALIADGVQAFDERRQVQGTRAGQQAGVATLVDQVRWGMRRTVGQLNAGDLP